MNDELTLLLLVAGMLFVMLGIAGLIAQDGRVHERSLREARARAFERNGGNGRYWE